MLDAYAHKICRSLVLFVDVISSMYTWPFPFYLTQFFATFTSRDVGGPALVPPALLGCGKLKLKQIQGVGDDGLMVDGWL